MIVYVARWYHTWGEFNATAGVYTTLEQAEKELARILPNPDGDIAWHEIEKLEIDTPAEPIPR
jgi:hypothetical protein